MPANATPNARSSPPRRWPTILLAAFLAWWLLLAIAPWYREDWLLENVIVFVTVPILVWNWRRLPFADGTYTALFVFLLLHEVGAHYTYAKVPYDEWWRSLFGSSLNEALGFSRNNFDRLVHFLYGVLVTPAVVELLAARAPPKGIWRFWLPVFFIMANACLYEIVEGIAATWFGGGLGMAYLGIQGDIWDSNKDMALASLGSLLTMLAIWLSGRLGHSIRTDGFP